MSLMTDLSNLSGEVGFYGIFGGTLFHYLDTIFDTPAAGTVLNIYQVPKVFVEAVIQIFLDGMAINMMTDFLIGRGYTTDNRDILMALMLPGFQPNLLTKLDLIANSIKMWLMGLNPLAIPTSSSSTGAITTVAPLPSGQKCTATPMTFSRFSN